MNIKIKLYENIKNYDDTNKMAEILKIIANDLENGLIDGFYEDFEFHYLYKDI